MCVWGTQQAAGKGTRGGLDLLSIGIAGLYG